MDKQKEKAIKRAQWLADKKGYSRIVFYECGEWLDLPEWLAEEQLCESQWHDSVEILPNL